MVAGNYKYKKNHINPENICLKSAIQTLEKGVKSVQS